MLIFIIDLVIVLGVAVYYRKRKKYMKRICTLKVEAHIAEREDITASVRGFEITIGGVYHPVYRFYIDGTERFLVERKRVWTALGLEQYASSTLTLWVNPQNIKQFRYDDERLERQDAGGYVFICVSCIIVATIAVLSFS